MRSRLTEKTQSTECSDLETGPYVIRKLLSDLPLSVEGGEEDIHITCVEFFESNLYIGTSASDLLHYVQIQPDPKSLAEPPSYILASRLLPAYHKSQTTPQLGVQQILLLPSVGKACILCNRTATFYSLPELSPAFGTTQIRPCNWIGGVDLDLDPNKSPEDGSPPSVTFLVSLNKKIRVIKISKDPRGIKTIDFSGSIISVRRNSYACVADVRSYALLDIDRLLKIPLFTISSQCDSRPVNPNDSVEEAAGNDGEVSKKGISLTPEKISGLSTSNAQSRGASLANFIGISSYTNSSNSKSVDEKFGKFQEENIGQGSSILIANNSQTSLPLARSSTKQPSPYSAEMVEQDSILQEVSKPIDFLKPHILSPTPQEFLLVTGTGQNDPGVGMFVNLEGDPTRSTIEFDQYPHEVVVDGRGINADSTPTNFDTEEEGYVLATFARESISFGIEIQRWDLDQRDDSNAKYWLDIPTQSSKRDKIASTGLRSTYDAGLIYFSEVVDKLRLRNFRPFDHEHVIIGESSSLTPGTEIYQTNYSPIKNLDKKNLLDSDDNLSHSYEDQRSSEEREFSKQFGQTRSRIVVWSGNTLWWVVRNPVILQMGASIPENPCLFNQNDHIFTSSYREQLIRLLNKLKGLEAKSDTDYLSLGYLRQRAGLCFFLNGLGVNTGVNTGIECDFISTPELRIAEDALLEGGLDPRVILTVIPYLRKEVDEGKFGIWIHAGIKDIVDEFIINYVSKNTDNIAKTLISNQTLLSLKRYLTAWRKKSGLGSIADKNEISKSVDASLLIVLLRLDKLTPQGPPKTKSIRTELYDVVDHGVNCFERAIQILEAENRLFILSRLYQSQKMSSKVLETWRRILEGEPDVGDDFVDGEQKVQDYLLKIRSISLVQFYGVWLAARNPKLGVRVFAEERSQVKFDPKTVLQILRLGASGAVKDYLEHLVFHKNHPEYINELITYYLDIVTNKLEESLETRLILEQSYNSYRGLRPPKPTYHQFITENSIDEEWWQSRLRLLHLLGSRTDSTSKYDFKAIHARIAPYSQELVPELIILDGWQANHGKAIYLLTHSLGDYDTAINYCLLGGSGIYHPLSSTDIQEGLPARDQQARLFAMLLSEFLRIEDVSNRVEQTSNLLRNFGGWFTVEHVLKIIPDTWSLNLLSEYLSKSLGLIIKERNETMVLKALTGTENLKVITELIEKINEAGFSYET